MYEILKKENTFIPISVRDEDYGDYILSGYEVIFKGTKRECLNYLDEMSED